MTNSVCILAHHNPWLFNSSIISLMMQNYSDYELHIIYIKGDGYKTHKNKNIQLTPDDERILKFLEKIKINYIYHEVENGHGLDSSAWYKFIKNKKWKKYDYSLFLMEGFIFTSKDSLRNIMEFSKENSINFLDMGFEKRIITRQRWETLFIEDDSYHQNQVDKILIKFSKDKNFAKIIEHWGDYKTTFKIGQDQHHLPIKAFKLIHVIKYIIKGIIKDGSLVNIFKKLIFISNDGDMKLLNLEDVVDEYKIYNRNIFHKEDVPFYFGCMCQHLFSREFLTNFDSKLQKNNLYELIDLPFSASALEIIWGFLPTWLDYDKWYTDAIHRPRKNYISRIREDNIDVMCKYLNIYYKNLIHTSPSQDLIKIKVIDDKYNYMNKISN